MAFTEVLLVLLVLDGVIMHRVNVVSDVAGTTTLG